MFHCEIDGLEFDNSPTISANDLRANTVQIYCIRLDANNRATLRSGGTGVIMSPDTGIILTNHHVITYKDDRSPHDKDCDQIHVRVQGLRNILQATLVKHCATIDRARIRIIDTTTLTELRLPTISRATAPAQRDQEIYYWGYGGDTFRYEIKQNPPELKTGVVQTISWDDVIVDVFGKPGDSGSPVYNEYGHLLGTMYAGNSSDRGVFTGDLCGEEATPTHTTTASVPSVESADPTPTDEGAATDTPTPVPAGASRDNLIPLGQPGTTHDDFMLQVTGVQKDAYHIIVQANEDKSYYQRLSADHTYIMVRIKVKNLSPEPQSLDTWDRLGVVGQSNLEFLQCHTPAGGSYYRNEVPEEYDDDRLMFQDGELEGNLCFAVKSSDVDSLVMFDKSESNWLYFALQ
ncbi:MAG: trypsin-like peptidase domain-containing protein [Chloroflexi bacterium]|nr:trypsin-like peptidase domain-containing protein [Chloroflexota bacterium]